MSDKKKPLILIASVLVVAAVAVVVLFPGSSGTSKEGASDSVQSGENLVIPVAEVTEKAAFYQVDIEGTQMEVMAVRDSQGEIRTAFNTCQSCYDSGRGYYKQEGDYLVCQNCGTRFTADDVEVEAFGCNPYPIFEENKTVTGDTIEISYEFLKESTDLFASWKR